MNQRQVPPPPPIGPPPIPVHVVQTQPFAIERTSKKWKKRFLIGLAFLVLGVILPSPSYDSQEGDFLVLLKGVSILLGLCVIIYSKIGAWWDNG